MGQPQLGQDIEDLVVMDEAHALRPDHHAEEEFRGRLPAISPYAAAPE